MLSEEKVAEIVGMMVDGQNDHDTSRKAGVSRDSVTKLRRMIEAGAQEGYCDPLPRIREGRPLKRS